MNHMSWNYVSLVHIHIYKLSNPHQAYVCGSILMTYFRYKNKYHYAYQDSRYVALVFVTFVIKRIVPLGIILREPLMQRMNENE